jgi:hypothetical protein
VRPRRLPLMRLPCTWLNTSIAIPPGNSDVHVPRTFPPAPGHPFLLIVLDEETDERGNPIHEIEIDAESGLVLEDTFSIAHPSLGDAITASVETHV